MDQGWAALLGAFIGGGFALAGTLITLGKQANDAKKKEAALTSATALLILDDYLHYQATLARALDRKCWWDVAEMLPRQASIKDRKIVWAALPTPEDTFLVAAAQGWMDYLTQRQHLVTTTEQAPFNVNGVDLGTMRETFCSLEHARETLAAFTRRAFMPFDHSRVLETLTTPNQTVPGLLGGKPCPEKKGRRLGA